MTDTVFGRPPGDPFISSDMHTTLNHIGTAAAAASLWIPAKAATVAGYRAFRAPPQVAAGAMELGQMGRAAEPLLGAAEVAGEIALMAL